MTFVSTEDIWIEAYYRENSLGNVTVGDEVEVALDFAPGRIVKGRVSSIDWGGIGDKTIKQVNLLRRVNKLAGCAKLKCCQLLSNLNEMRCKACCVLVVRRM